MEADRAHFAERILAAEERFREALQMIGGLSPAEARAAFKRLDEARALRRDHVLGHVTVKHGAYLERDVLRRAAGSLV